MLLSHSLSRLSLLSVQTLAQELYNRVNDSITSLVHIQYSKKKLRYDPNEKTTDAPVTIFCRQDIRKKFHFFFRETFQK